MLFVKLKSIAVNLGIILLVAVPLLSAGMLPSTAYAASSKSAACEGVGLTGGNCDGKAASTTLSNLVSDIVNVISVIVGIAAIIMIIIAAFKYITSGGDTNKVASAKSALIYAIVGLIIVALAQFMVNFVLSKV